MDYEVTLKELENIIEEMESSDIKLEDMMEKYKKAIDLYKDLEKYLENYKKEIKIVKDRGLEDFNGETTNE